MNRWHFGVNLLGIGAGCLMILAMFFPWWSFRWEFVEQTDVYPYVLSGPGTELVGYQRSPEMLLLTGVVIACILLCLLGSLIKRRAGWIMMAISGVLILIAAWRLIARVSGVAARFGLPVIGHGRGNLGGFAWVETWTWLQPGFYLVVSAGVLALAAGLLHHKIWLEPKSRSMEKG
jgi:hypothetical protein